MSFSSRRSPRFSYGSSPAACPTEFLGQSTFFQEQEPPRHGCTERPASAYVAARPMSPQRRVGYDEPVRFPGREDMRWSQGRDLIVNARGYFTEDEKRLMTLLGGGLIVAILIDAVAHSK